MYKYDARDDAEKVLSKSIFDMYMSSENSCEYNKKIKEVSDTHHKYESYLKSMVQVYVDSYATDEEYGAYCRKRQTMTNRIPKYVKFCEELFKTSPDRRIEYVDSTGISYGDVMGYLRKYRDSRREYSHLVDEFYDKYSILMEDRKQKEDDERIQKKYSDACKFFDNEIISKGYYSIAEYVDSFEENKRKSIRSFAYDRRKIIFNRDPNVWECYARKMAVNKVNSYLMLKDNIDSFVGQMVNGGLNNDKVDVIDYYMTVGIPFKKFKDICEGYLSETVMSLFNIFITPYVNIENMGFDDESYSKINYSNSETGKFVSDEEKLCVIDFLRKNNIPTAYFQVALNKYLKGDLDIKFKSLKKEIQFLDFFLCYNQFGDFMSVYIHIPFCDNICSYCDFCKVFYNSKLVDDYLVALRNEINLNYEGEVIDTIYIGGGTPSSLNLEQLGILFDIIKVFKLNSGYEFTFECNIENIDFDKLKFLYDNGVNRLSIGVQTFNEKFLKFLNRNHTSDMVVNKIGIAKKIGFNNINIDLIYAIPGETLDDLNHDIDMFLSLDINHISTYSLILEEHTKLYVDGVSNIDEDMDRSMYELICDRLSNDFNHYEISNFGKPGYESKHNLVYWNNCHYYGFGCGASGYVGNVRYDNTRSLNKYISGNYRMNEDVLDRNTIIENEFILGLRKINGINICDFNKKYGNIFNDVVNRLILEGKLINDGINVYINPDYVYVSNSILVDFMGENYE